MTIDDEVYCEGALKDTVNFRRLLEDHPDLDEIWVSRIVDEKQVTAPKNIKDALGNLCMLFAASLGDDDVKLFKYHAQDEHWEGTIYEINFQAAHVVGRSGSVVAAEVNFDWTYSNLDHGIARGRAAIAELLNFYFCIKYYLADNLDKAVIHADSLTRDDYSLGQVAKAVTYHAVHEPDRAQDAILALLKTDMAWYKYPERELAKTFFKPGTVDRLMQALRDAGLPE